MSKNKKYNHWADRIALRIINTRPKKEMYICAAGISPSGSVHIGNFRDVATIFFVSKALRDLGKKVSLIFSWDEFDRFRKVPKNIPNTFEEYIGRPYTSIPDPFGCHKSYAQHFENEFCQAMQSFGINLEYRYQSEMYKSGCYTNGIITALKYREKIFHILSDFRTKKEYKDKREDYYPITIYCKSCGKDTTKVKKLSDDCKMIFYTCKCGNKENLFIENDGKNIKLPWKIDWAMRWMHEKVDFEPGGKDHATPGGSYTVSKRISEEIYNYQAPIFQGYEFVGIVGATSKMSGSSGLSITPKEILKVYQPEIILWQFSKYAPNKAFKISLGEEVLRQYDEFDRAMSSVNTGKASAQTIRNLEFSFIDRKEIPPIPFRQLSSFSTIVQKNLKVMEEIFDRIGTPYKEKEFRDRFEKSEYWQKKYSPDTAIELLKNPNHIFFSKLEIEEKEWVNNLCHILKTQKINFEYLTKVLYSIPKNENLNEKDNKLRQKKFFSIIYMLMIGKDTGPRLATFLIALDKNTVIKFLCFNYKD